ncbi:hypothetical protein GGF43_004056, partial [Coemansia sp. RSA 2618]
MITALIARNGKISRPASKISRALRPATQISGLATHAARASAQTPKPMVLGIRREDKNRWERRVALTPAHVKRLIKETGARVLVQP